MQEGPLQGKRLKKPESHSYSHLVSVGKRPKGWFIPFTKGHPGALLTLAGNEHSLPWPVLLHVLKPVLWNRTEIRVRTRAYRPGRTGDEGGSQNICRNWFQEGPICLKAEEVYQVSS